MKESTVDVFYNNNIEDYNSALETLAPLVKNLSEIKSRYDEAFWAYETNIKANRYNDKFHFK